MNNDNADLKTGHTVRRYCKVSTQSYNKINKSSKSYFFALHAVH